MHTSAHERPNFTEDLSRGLFGGGEAIAQAATGGPAALGGGLGFLGTLGATRDPEAARAVKEGIQEAMTYKPRSPEGRAAGELVGQASGYLGEKPGKVIGNWVMDKTGRPVLATGAETLANIPQFLIGSEIFRRGEAKGETPLLTADEKAGATPAQLSYGPGVGAAGAAIDLSRVTPETRAAVMEASKRGAVNHTALERQMEAETLPMPEGETPLRLRRSSALGEAQGFGDEYNLQDSPETEGLIKRAIVGEDRKLAGSITEIKRRAVPDIVQMSTDEHGQSAVTRIKAVDNARLDDISSKYKSLQDANGGQFPIDGQTLSTGALAAVDKANRTEFLPSPVRSWLQRQGSNEHFDFNDYETGRTILATAARAADRSGDGNAAQAIHAARDYMENFPINDPKLKPLADAARTAVRERYADIRAIPAYKAVVDDNVPMVAGRHDLEARSPMAESFLPTYFTGGGKTASRAYVERAQNLMQGDPEFRQHIEGGTLNQLRDAAGVNDAGEAPRGFRNVGYENALNKVRSKSDVLLSKDADAATQQLQRVAGYVKNQPVGATPNRAGTALALIRHGAMYGQEPGLASEVASHIGTLAAGKVAGPGGVLAKQYIEGRFMKAKGEKIAASQAAAKLRYAQEATKPGAGISIEPPVGETP